MKWENIEGNKLIVDKQTSRGNNNKVIITFLKNSSSYREIQLNEELVRELKKFKLVQNEMSLKHPSYKMNKEG
ncbi:hypothetical protein A33I_17280 [Alkalihalophilus marmarensis DSM 21297]|uniref:Uncharacterized protein n=1 Tax=Alkalihalophilus marmarensis DSM 21297 TaxID=1188261 RepID=U6SKK0_9BACI|nr:hypothetical protein A33I_17280 [Alkalihalophilus marmarensis DSM 21297]